MCRLCCLQRGLRVEDSDECVDNGYVEWTGVIQENLAGSEKCILQGREVTSLHCQSVEVRLPVVGLGH